MSYHLVKIDKGVLGEFSKIIEEFEELEDAHNQGNPILELVELCDLIGAIEAYAENRNISLNHLIKMMNATKRAFLQGSRS